MSARSSVHWLLRCIVFVAVAAFMSPALAITGAEVLSGAGVTAGLAVSVGTTDGILEEGLANGGRVVVLGLAQDRDACDAARSYLETKGLYGVVSVDICADLSRLPVFDDLLSLIVADLDALGPKGLTRQELLRAVAPGAVAYVKDGGTWKNVVKDYPAGYGAWSQFDGGPWGGQFSNDLAIAPVTSVQWIGDYESLDIGRSLAEGAGCRIWKNWQVSISNAQSAIGDSLVIKCRDAFNGRLLWYRHVYFGRGEDYDPRGRGYALGDGKLFAVVQSGGPVVAIDLATGQAVKEYTSGLRYNPSTAKLNYFLTLYHDGHVVAAHGNDLCVMDAATGAVKWTRTDGPYTFGCFNGSRFYTTTGSYGGMGRQLILGSGTRKCFDLATGNQVWSAATSGSLVSFGYYEGTVVEFGEAYACCGSSSGHIAVIDAATGQQKWKQSYGSGDYDGDVATGLAMGSSVFAAGDSRLVKYDINTGAATSGSSGRSTHGACKRGSSTPNYLITNGSNFWDSSLTCKFVHIARGGCGMSTYPANGMLYAPPTTCGCYKMLKGYHATRARAFPAATPEALRLEKVAAAPAPMAAGTAWPKDDEWPMLRRDIRRSSRTPTAVGAGAKKLWETKVGSNGTGVAWTEFAWNNVFSRTVTPVSVSGGRVFAALTHRHQVVALDANDGNELWRYTAGGRVDGPPTIYGDLCLFGCNDGWVYCLNAVTGDLVWRRLLANTPERMGAYGQAESECPVSASVVIYEGNVFAVGGRHVDADGGFRVNKINPYSGEIIWADSVSGSPVRRTGVKGSPVIPLLRPIAFDGTLLMMDCLAIHPTLERACNTYYYIDVHNPPEHLWAAFRDVTAEQWDFHNWELGRAVSDNFANQEGGRGGSTGQGYGTARSRNATGGSFVALTDTHLYAMKGRQLLRTALDSTGNPVANFNNAGKDLNIDTVFDLAVVYPNLSASSPALRGMVLAGNDVCFAVAENALKDKTTEAPHVLVVTLGSGAPQKFPLPARPEWNGIAVAYGKVFVSTEDGSITAVGDGTPIDVAVRGWDPEIARPAGGPVFDLSTASGFRFDKAAERGAVDRGKSDRGLVAALSRSVPSGTGDPRATAAPTLLEERGMKGALREFWAGVPSVGALVREGETPLAFLTEQGWDPETPSGSQIVSSLRGKADWADNYFERIRGFIVAPETGEYTFYLAADDQAALYLAPEPVAVSADLSNPGSVSPTLLARVTSAVAPDDFDAAEEQMSPSVRLEAGQRYYFEVLHAEGDGDDHCSVAWRTPEHRREVIGGEWLAR